MTTQHTIYERRILQAIHSITNTIVYQNESADTENQEDANFETLEKENDSAFDGENRRFLFFLFFCLLYVPIPLKRAHVFPYFCHGIFVLTNEYHITLLFSFG